MTRLDPRQVPKAQRPKGRGSTELEETLAWQIKASKIVGVVREYQFHPTRKWRFDFAVPTARVAVEVEGGTWVTGAHGRGAHFESDAEKYNEAAILGWMVMRVTTDMVEDGRALAFLNRALTAVADARIIQVRSLLGSQG